MSFYDGLSFFILLGLCLIPSVILGLKEKSQKYYIAALSVFFILTIFKSEPLSLLYLIAYLFLEWHLIALYQWSIRKFGKSKPIFHHAVLFAIIPLALAKLGGFIGHSWFAFIGISYITFRVLQIIIESYDGLIEKSSLFDTMNFLIFFPSLSSGPIDRSRRFDEDIHNTPNRSEYVELLGDGLWKIVLGALYKFVLSAISFDILEKLDGRYDPQYIIAYAVIYGAYIFFDFAGYSLMAIGTGYIMGIRLPDNFNKPFISKDIKEFWDRWHISLSHWFKDFVFSRFIMSAIKNKRFKNRLNAASAGFIVNMLIMGVWHGITFDYILYGLYHGVLLAVTEIYQKKCKFYKNNRQKKWYQLLSWFVTMAMVMFGFLIFSGKFTELVKAVI